MNTPKTRVTICVEEELCELLKKEAKALRCSVGKIAARYIKDHIELHRKFAEVSASAARGLPE